MIAREPDFIPSVSEKRYYAACLDLDGRRCLVVGGGVVAREKPEGLLEAGARVTVVAPDLSAEVRALEVELIERGYRRRDLGDHILVIAATDDTALNARVHADAEERGIFCNVADVPELCSFILPAIYSRAQTSGLRLRSHARPSVRWAGKSGGGPVSG